MAAGAIVLEVASYNVHRCVGVDRRLDPERVARVLREIDADIVSLQEVESTPGAEGTSAQLSALASSAGLAGVAGPTLLGRRRGFGNALLTRHPVVGCRHVDLSVRDREPRGALAVDLAIGPRRVRVIGTHLGLRGAERRRQVLCLLQLCGEERPAVVLLLGDFNEWLPGARNLRYLRRLFGVAPAPPTFPSWRPVLALDRIWARPGHALGAVRVHASWLARRASDHLPVRGTVRLS